MEKPELSEAASEGDLEAIRSLLDAGADIRYVRPSGYTVTIDVLHSPLIDKDSELLQALKFLIDRGANLDVVSDYGESALSVTARVGRFDAVRLLLDSGADPSPLGWSELHRAVTLGTLDDVRLRLEAWDDLAAPDGWERTPLLLSLQVGDIEKAELLLSAGGSLADRGRCGKTPLMYAVEKDDPAMLRWLLNRRVAPDSTDDFGGTALVAAAGGGAAKCVRVMLEAGADPNLVSGSDTPMSSAANLEIARMPAEAGADFALINGSVRDEVTGRRRTESIECTPEQYQAAKHRIFGNANPQLMNLPFWRAMVAFGQSAYQARTHFDQETYGGEAVWCFDRFGKSFTELPDGQVIEIGGEYEDSYDQDFCIYNDVVVHHGDDEFDIYGYAEKVFPPTDFHSATLLDGRVIVIGRLGYHGTRVPGTTPVMELDTATYRIRELPSHGELPGWIFRHEARLCQDGIVIRGGEVVVATDGDRQIVRNVNDFLYDPATGAWKRLTDRKWRQFSIADAEDKPYMRAFPMWANTEDDKVEDPFVHLAPESLRPRHIAYESPSSTAYGTVDRIIVDGVDVRIAFETFSIEIVIEGDMEAGKADALIADIRKSIEEDTGRPCVVTAH